MVKEKMMKAWWGSLSMAGVLAMAIVFGIAAGTPQAMAEKAKDAKKPPQDAWVKLCEKAPDAKAKEKGKMLDICLTNHERIDGNTGRVIVSAAVRQISGKDKEAFLVMVPLGMVLPAGVEVRVDKNKPVNLKYTLCHLGGCTAEAELTADLKKQLSTGKQLIVAAMPITGKPIGFPVPLAGFDKAYKGKPIDNKKYRAARKKLMEIIRKRQAALIQKAREEAQKKQEKKK